MDRAYSLLTIKSVDNSARTFAGIATTPTTDRVGDVVESEGASYRLPIPLLLYHDSTRPVGDVVAAEVKSSGISVRGRIAELDEPGTVKDRLDEAWHSVKAGLIRGLSIGFRPLAGGVESMRNGGMRFTSWEWMELSLVPLPANADATITAVKHYAGAGRTRGGIALLTADRRAALGRKGVRLIDARARGNIR